MLFLLFLFVFLFFCFVFFLFSCIWVSHNFVTYQLRIIIMRDFKFGSENWNRSMLIAQRLNYPPPPPPPDLPLKFALGILSQNVEDLKIKKWSRKALFCLSFKQQPLLWQKNLSLFMEGFISTLSFNIPPEYLKRWNFFHFPFLPAG